MKTFYQEKLEQYFLSRLLFQCATLDYKSYVARVRWLWPWENQTKEVKAAKPKESYEVPLTRMPKNILRIQEAEKIKALKMGVKVAQRAFTKAENDLRNCIQSHL